MYGKKKEKKFLLINFFWGMDKLEEVRYIGKVFERLREIWEKLKLRENEVWE